VDYQSNARKSKADKEEVKQPEKQIEKVVTGEVVQKPKTIGRKFKDIFFGGDFKVATKYVAADVLLPALRNLIVDMTSKGIERVVYGESSYRQRNINYPPRIQYNNPIHRTLPADPRSRGYLPGQQHMPRSDRREINDVILASRAEAELVVERLVDVIDKYEVASLADYYDLLGLPTTHVDNKWGWTFLNNIDIRQVRDGYLIELPALEVI
jgi:hypothetical protein